MTRLLHYVLAFVCTAAVYGDSDELYILLDTINSYECAGVTNQIQISKKDIQVTDYHDNPVRYIKAPGDYKLQFNNIKVQQALGNLAGEISATLQVPVFEGPVGLRFDYPYQLIPETRAGVATCDNLSGAVNNGDRPYCRYCRLCETSDTAVEQLGKYKIDQTDQSESARFRDVCRKVDSNTYAISKKISLPGKAKLEEQAQEKFGSIDAQTKQRLQEGRGRFQVFLNLLSSDDEPISSESFYVGDPQCRCCSNKLRNELSCKVISAIACNTGRCSSKYAQTCLSDKTTVVACLAVEFNYQVTQKYTEVSDFLRARGLPDDQKNGAASAAAASGPAKQVDTEDDIKDKCVKVIAASNNQVLYNYCRTFWKRDSCCSHCDGVC